MRYPKPWRYCAALDSIEDATGKTILNLPSGICRLPDSAAFALELVETVNKESSNA